MATKESKIQNTNTEETPKYANAEERAKDLLKTYTHPEDFISAQRKSAKASFLNELGRIKNRYKAYDVAYRIAEEWLQGDMTRSVYFDSSLPIYLHLRLGVTDSVPDALVFLESIEDTFGEMETYKLDMGDHKTIEVYHLEDHRIKIFLQVGESTHCKIVEETETKFEEIKKVTGRKVICI